MAFATRAKDVVPHPSRHHMVTRQADVTLLAALARAAQSRLDEFNVQCLVNIAARPEPSGPLSGPGLGPKLVPASPIFAWAEAR